MPPEAPAELKTAYVLDSPIAMTTYAEAVQYVLDQVRTGTRVLAVEAANVHVVTLARTDSEFAESMRKFDLLLPDGMPLVWTLNRAGARLTDRVYGPTFMLKCLEATEHLPDIRHYLLGGTPEMLQSLELRLKTLYPSLNIAGSYSPPFGDWPSSEDAAIRERIRASGANYIWVGLGCPKQEHWIARNKADLIPGAYFAIGAAFAFHAGKVRQAPSWMQKLGLEWLFRLLAEPRRLFRRYVVFNSLFLYHSARDRWLSTRNMNLT